MGRRLLDQFGSVLVLLLLCAYYTWATWSVHHPNTAAAGRELALSIVTEQGPDASVVIVVRTTTQDRSFAGALGRELRERGATVLDTVRASTPAEAGQTILQKHGFLSAG